MFLNISSRLKALPLSAIALTFGPKLKIQSFKLSANHCTISGNCCVEFRLATARTVDSICKTIETLNQFYNAFKVALALKR